jgi:predicted nucleic acid-binding protein
MTKANIDEKEFDLLLVLFFEKIALVAKEEYSSFMKEANSLILDKSDIPFIALALKARADGIWSDDSDFLKQNKIKIYTTKEMIDFCNL